MATSLQPPPWPEHRVHPAALAGKSVLILGLGSFGGGAGCARALIRAGAKVTITDLRPAEQLGESLVSLAGLAPRLALGGHDEGLFATADWVVVNPAVPPSSPWLQVARRHGCQLTTEINLALAKAAEVPAVAITGTHGKSTTAAFCAHLGQALPGHTCLGGNLGGSLLEQVDGLGPGDRLVVELSSFQLERLVAPAGWPRVALLTCLGEDHLDRHLDLADYLAAKRRLLEAQDANGLLLLPAHGTAVALPPPMAEEVEQWRRHARGSVHDYHAADLATLAPGWTPAWPEAYRRAAASAAWQALLSLLGRAPTRAEQSALEQAAATFAGLPHRLQEVAGPANRRILDNGVATHPEATAAALDSLTGSVHLLAGGKDKGLALTALLRALRPEHHLHLHGAGGNRLADAVRNDPQAQVGGVQEYPDFASAVRGALAALSEGESLLFSPSFSSFDEFSNFRQRASKFLEICAAFNFCGQREQVTRAAGRTNRELGQTP